MINIKKYEIFKNRILSMINDYDFKNRISNLLSLIEQDMFFERVLNKKANLKLRRDDDGKGEILQTDFISIRLDDDNRITYQTKKTNFTFEGEGIFYTEDDYIFVDIIQRDKSKKEETMRRKFKVYNNKLEQVVFLDEYDNKYYKENERLERVLDDSFNFPLINCNIKNIYIKTCKDEWTRTEIVKNHVHNSSRKEYVDCSIIDNLSFSLMCDENAKIYQQGQSKKG